jgi:hypothetical protein
VSVLAWVRQPAGAPGHRALAHLVERLGILRAVGLDPSLAEGVHPERLRRLAREGGRFTAQHLRALAPLRRRATLVAAVLDAATRLTDDGVELFDRAVGRMFRRAEAREQDALLRDARAINDKVRLLARLGAALIEAREAKADLERRSPTRWAGTGWRAASPRPSAWRGRTRPISRRSPRGPGRSCAGSGRCSSAPSASGPSRPPPRRCARSRRCTASTRAAGGAGRAACPSPSSPRLARGGARRRWPRGRRPPHLGGGHPARFARSAAGR